MFLDIIKDSNFSYVAEHKVAAAHNTKNSTESFR